VSLKEGLHGGPGCAGGRLDAGDPSAAASDDEGLAPVFDGVQHGREPAGGVCSGDLLHDIRLSDPWTPVVLLGIYR